MEFSTTPIPGVVIIQPQVHEDNRGWFARTYCLSGFADAGINFDIVQINHSFNPAIATFRGFHFQPPPFCEKKLIRCVFGRIVDIVVDLRCDSPTFLNSYQIELSANNRKMIFLPEGVAHGFLTLELNSSLLYHHSEYYQTNAETGLRYDDPMLNVSLPLPPKVISDRDRSHPLLTSDFNGLIC